MRGKPEGKEYRTILVKYGEEQGFWWDMQYKTVFVTLAGENMGYGQANQSHGFACIGHHLNGCTTLYRVLSSGVPVATIINASRITNLCMFEDLKLLCPVIVTEWSTGSSCFVQLPAAYHPLRMQFPTTTNSALNPVLITSTAMARNQQWNEGNQHHQHTVK
jgi:hypothetical protein